MPPIPSTLAHALQQAGLAPEQVTLLEGLPERRLLRIDVSGEDAWRSWQHFRSSATDAGFWPVLVGSPEGPDFVFGKWLGFSVPGDYDDSESEPSPAPPAPAAILAAAEELPFEKWTSQRRNPQWWSQHYLAKAEQIERIGGEGSGLARLYRQFAAEWRDNPPRDPPIEEYTWPPESEQLKLQVRPSTLETFDEDWHCVLAETVALVFCPVVQSWQVLAHLPYNPVEDSDRPPAVHVAALRWLSERYGAELIGIGDRTIEVLPRHRPATQDEALKLAREVGTYATCPSTGDENTKTPQWAAFLMHSPFWSFCCPG